MELSIGIITLNAKFIHSSLSLRYLRNAARAAGHKNIWIQEYIINQPVWKISADILKRKPDVIGISIYIWNRAQSFQLIELLKKQCPALSIVIGGPEVSFEPSLADGHVIIAGEGENKWVEYLGFRSRKESPPLDVLNRWNAYGVDLPDLSPAYLPEDLADLKNRMVYMESSRGCPYHCSFCLSALDKTVRYFDDNMVRDQIMLLANNNVKTIKFIDRTFNLQPRRMMSLLQWLTQFHQTTFHFEVVGDILTDDMLDFLDTVPEGLFQFEIGVQTTTESVHEVIQRKQDNERVFSAISRLANSNKIHVHADLIFGLPGENRKQALKSFSSILALKPHELQLGFLKFLPGAPIRESINSHQYQFQSFPPYEMLSNMDLSAEEVIYLKNFTEVFDNFYNSKRFAFSIDRLLTLWPAVELFNHLLSHLENQPQTALSLDNQYQLFAEAFNLLDNVFSLDLLKLDYLYHQKVYRLPQFMQRNVNGKTFKAWQGDKKTPLVPFQHEIRIAGSQAHLTPSQETTYYAVVHPQGQNSYITRPNLMRVLI